MTLNQKVAQCFSPAVFIHDTEENHHHIEQLITGYGIGGLTFFHSRQAAAANFEKRAEKLAASGSLEKLIQLINRFQAVSRIPLLISIDGEYGLAMRVEDTPAYPFAISLGALRGDVAEKVEELGYQMGLDMKQAGIHLNLAPCADVNTQAKNPVIGYRSFGDDARKVSRLAWACYSGMQRAGIGACYKHFPGHGDTIVDSHIGLPIIQKSRAQLEKEELVPFQYGIDRGLDLMMVGHIAVPALTGGESIPASISERLIRDLLRGEMGFQGIVISDALNMKAVSDLFPEAGELEWQAFRAGNDILCFSENVAEGIEKIGQLADPAEIVRTFEKIMDLKKRLGVFDQKWVPVPVFDWEAHARRQADLAQGYVSVISGILYPVELQRQAHAGKLGYREFFSDSPSFFSTQINLQEEHPKLVEKMILAVFVPSHKPLNQFGMEPKVLEEIQALAQEKPCILIHFGNPLALEFLQPLISFEAVICAYQRFEEVQQVVLERLGFQTSD